MKFIHYVEKISGVSIYGLSSLLIFGSFFLIMLIWAVRADKGMMEELRQLPLDKIKGAGKIPVILIGLLLMGSGAFAAGPPVPSSIDNTFVILSLVIIVILGIAIGLLANVLLGAAQIPISNEKAPAGSSGDLPANNKEAVTASPRSPWSRSYLFLTATAINGVSDTAFYFISGVIILEVLILLTLLYNVRLVLSIHKKAKAAAEGKTAAAPAKPRVSWWAKANSFKPIAEEADLDLGHDYDGIRELDNRLPPWWLYGFYCTIIFACVYLWRYHVSHTAPLSGQEYAISVQQADIAKAEYLKKAANLVDETTVKRLTSTDELAAGQKIIETTCFACHGKSGEGGVGPNLTDEYWLHGGSIQDVFKTIKYGWPDKGMKSWKDDFSPSQIAEIASYVK
ncbi:MAG TPA: cbb3-type cytochrome c oxidase N-terminal domain-containing protein, partial [Puia sp.]